MTVTCESEIRNNPLSLGKVVEDAINPRGDLLRKGATPQEVYDDALRVALGGNIVRISNVGNPTAGGTTIGSMPTVPRTPGGRTSKL